MSWCEAGKEIKASVPTGWCVREVDLIPSFSFGHPPSRGPKRSATEDWIEERLNISVI